MKEIKEEDLMNYLYNEASPEMNEAIEKAIAENPTLKDQLELLQLSMNQLDKLKLKSPSKESIKVILDYAKKNKLD